MGGEHAELQIFRDNLKGLLPPAKKVERATATLPQTTQAALFTVSGGRCLVTSIVGEVTTVIETQANNTKVVFNPTLGADTDLCAVLDITADAVGTLYSVYNAATALFGMIGVGVLPESTGFIVQDGTIDLNCAASNTGSVKWTVHYVPLDDGAKIVAA